jgi:PAS domain S-box-containing protein
MTWHFSPYSVPLLVGALVLIISSFLVLRRAPTLANSYLAFVNLLIIVFSGGYGLELMQTSFEGVYFWQKVGFLGGAGSPVFLLLTVIAYYGPERWLTRTNHLMLLALPAVSTGLAWTNQYHGLIWQNPRIVPFGSLHLFEYEMGWWHLWVTSIYSLLMVFLSVAVLLFYYFRSEGAYRKQVILFLLGIPLPTLAYAFVMVSATLWGSIPMNWSAYALIITGMLITVSLLNTQVFQIGPIAYDAIFKHIEDVVVVLDDHNLVIDINPTAVRILKWERLAVIGKNLSALLSASELETLQPYLRTDDAQVELVWGDFHLDVKITSFKYQLQRSIGRLMVMRDISQRVVAENATRELAAIETRRHLARDLHDSMTQSLHSLILSAETAQHLHRESQPEKLTSSLEMLEDSARQALQEMRLLLYELQVTPAEEVDLMNFLEARLGAVERRMGIDTELTLDNTGLIPTAWEREIFFIIIEALNNTLKHSRADFVSIRIQGTPYQLTVTVTDNGIGFSPGQVRSDGMGLKNMQERAARLRGELSINSAPKNGTAVQLQIELGETE